MSDPYQVIAVAFVLCLDSLRGQFLGTIAVDGRYAALHALVC